MIEESVQPEIESTTWLAYERTRESYERTLQAWIRTGTSLITFGFSVYKFFQIEAPPAKQNLVVGPRDFGASLVLLGFVSLVFATAEYRRQIRLLTSRYHGGARRSLAVLIAALLSILAIVALIIMFMRA